MIEVFFYLTLVLIKKIRILNKIINITLQTSYAENIVNILAKTKIVGIKICDILNRQRTMLAD